MTFCWTIATATATQTAKVCRPEAGACREDPLGLLMMQLLLRLLLMRLRLRRLRLRMSILTLCGAREPPCPAMAREQTGE